jgi:hypothetical protein
VQVLITVVSSVTQALQSPYAAIALGDQLEPAWRRARPHVAQVAAAPVCCEVTVALPPLPEAVGWWMTGQGCSFMSSWADRTAFLAS